jgi:hypothetical protein
MLNQIMLKALILLHFIDSAKTIQSIITNYKKKKLIQRNTTNSKVDNIDNKYIVRLI